MGSADHTLIAIVLLTLKEILNQSYFPNLIQRLTLLDLFILLFYVFCLHVFMYNLWMPCALKSQEDFESPETGSNG